MEVQFFTPFGVIEANRDMMKIVTSQTRMQLLQHVVLLVRSQWRPILGEACLCTRGRRSLPPWYAVMHRLLSSHCSRAPSTSCLRIATCLSGFQTVLASGGDNNLHICESLSGDRYLILLC